MSDQLDLIRRGADKIEPLAELEKKLARGKPLRIKYGIDPTGIDVHLGHTVPLRKLRQFQELGHQAVIIIGDATALVGDPSGRDETRARLTPEKIAANAVEYLTQIGKVIDLTKAEVHHNNAWFGKFGLGDILSLTSKITVQRMLERDNFTLRVKAGTPIYLHECLYPLMQGWDSVEIKADVELGGSEQLYNLMVGRDLQRGEGQEPQICLTLPILRGLDGERRMGKSLGNYVGIGEPAREQFGKTMSIPDALLAEWYTLLTDVPADEAATLIAEQPMAAKKRLGREIVTFYYGAEAATAAQEDWEKQFSRKEDPSEIPEVTVPASELADGKISIVKLLVLVGFAKSNNDARRVLGPNSGVTVGPERAKVTEPTTQVAVTDGLILRVGKKIVRLRVAGI